jgi:flagellar biosynthetic protein FliQ
VTFDMALGLAREAIFVALLTAAPALLLGLAVGLIVSIFQAATQIQEPTLTFIPKILAMAVGILFFGPFMLAMMTDFTTRVFAGIPNYIR